MALKTYLSDKYNRLEVSFFIVYYLLFPILSGVEFNLLEYGRLNLAINELPGRLIAAVISVFPAWLCYKLLIQGYLFQKKYIRFLTGFVVYLVLLNFYIRYKYLAISKMSFLSEDLIKEAVKAYNSNVLVHFSTVYMLRDLLVLTALAYFIRSARLDKQISILGRQQLLAELNYLKMQIQPHFFFNTLNNIYALTLQRSDKAAPLIAKHAEIMRYILYNSSDATTTLKQEIEFLKNYTEVEAVRYPDKISINFESQGITTGVLIEPLLLLPFIENTFKHGISEATGDGFILIIISLIGNELSAEISNSRITGNNTSDQATGIGLKNAKKRLEMLYPDRHSLEIKEDGNIFTVYLALTLRSS